jgi:hypothetical protein
MMYDQKQLQNDLCNIVWRYGERQQRGFFTEGVYEDAHIRLVNRYTTPVEIYVNGILVEPDTILTESFTGHHILKLAVKIDEHLR